MASRERAPSQAVRAPPVVGREHETAVLGEILERARAGPAATAIVEGEAGIGKTRLLQAVMQKASAEGFSVLSGGAQELSGDRPFGALLDAVGLSLTDVAATPGSGSPISLPTSMTPDVRYRAVEAIVDRLERMLAPAPALLVIDDLQWADAGTIVALQRIVDELATAPLAVLIAARPLPRDDRLSMLLHDLEREGATRLQLAPLSDEQVVELATSALGVPPGANLRSMLARTGGNPFIAHEVLAAVRGQSLVPSGDTLDTPRTDAPDALRLVILQRISRLPPDVREVVRLASVLGTSFSAKSLTSFLARPATELGPLIEQALRSGELVADGDRLRYRHDIVREAAYEDIPTGIRAALHLQAARGLAAAGATATSVAAHFSVGAEPGDPEAVDWLRRAARETVASDPPTSVALLERALVLSLDSLLTDEIRRELLSALLWSGRLDDAIALGEELIGSADPADAATIRIALGTALEAQARWEDARGQFASVADAQVPEQSRALLVAHRAHLALPAGDVGSAAAAASEARELAHGRPSLALSIALHVQILIADVSGRWSDVPDLIREVERSQDSDPTGQARLWPARALAVLLCRAGDVDGADAVLRRGVRVAEETSLPLVLHTVLAALAWKELFAGRLDDAQAHAETALRVGRQTQALSAVVLSLSILARVAIHRGHLDDAEGALAEIVAEMSRHPLQYQAQMAMWGRALLAEARADPAEAHEAIASALDLVIALGWEGEVLDPAPDAVRLLLAAGDHDRARRITEVVERLADREGLPTLRGAALQCRGLLGSDPGLLRDAVAAWRRTGRPLDLARALEDAGRTFALEGRGEEAASPLDEAAKTYAAVGARRDHARCERTLRDLGVRRGARGPRTRAASGPDALTDAERRVAELAAEGLTNPEIARRLFISRHTVKTHLAHAFQKLGLRSRLELVRTFARTGR